MDQEKLKSSIQSLLSKTNFDDYNSDINESKVIHAKKFIKINGHSTADFFLILASINLLNAAIKKTEFKKLIHYADIKGQASRILTFFSRSNYSKYNIEFYINQSEKCAYVEIYDLQFSFHHIRLNEHLMEYVDSERNNVKPWREIRLQKIAGELFDIALHNSGHIAV
ncbi:MAG: hypothetical protein FGM54_04295 [Chitinophagaceae bacterium]|nr:hypothetical protein [Chitinophagaceae bacterium]